MKIDTNHPPSTDDQVQDLPSQRRSTAVTPASAFHAGPINILIVDDEPKNLTVLETVLDDPDFRLVRAGSVEQALHALVVEEFALLILDIRLPGMTGFELAQMIKQRKKTAGVPIIFLTAYYNEDHHVLEGYGIGAVDYLVKPVNPAILRSKVTVFAELHRKSRALLAEVTERRRVEEQLRELNDTLEQRVAERTQSLQIASAALQETGERYRSLFDGSLDAIFFLDADERFKAANPATLRLITRTLQELKTITFLDLCPPDQRETVSNAFRAALLGQCFAIDTTVVTVAGERRDLFISGTPEIQDGKVFGISCIARDITQRLKTEEALRRSEAGYRELIQALPAAIYTTDKRGHITLYNQAAVALWGREPEVAKDFWCGSWNIYRPDGTPLPLDECPMSVALREGRLIRDEEIVIERPDGTRRHVLPHPEPMRDAQGVVIGAINMLVDITERKQAEQAIAHLAAIVTSSDDAIISKNLQDIVMSWNVAAERLFGYTAEEMIGQPVARLIPDDRQDEEPGILARIRRGESIEHYETFRQRKDGTKLPVSLTVSPLTDLSGNVIGASEIVRNITEQKRVEEALRERDRTLTTVNDALKKQTVALAEANKELEGFSYSVSHDLRAPLRTIDAFSRIVEEEHGPHLNDEGRRSLTIVRKAVGQAGELIDDLLEFSKLGRQGMSFRLVKMADLAREVADDLRIMQEGRQVDLTIGDLPPCQGDRRFLKLVWINLLTNAYKFTNNRKETRIEVGWMPDDASTEAVIYYVKDNGVGFNMVYAHKLFEVFQRLHRREDFDGTGVGLAVVRRIVQRHDGRVWAEGKVDEGATFFVSLRKAMV
ncbi:MAG: PAS domain S-box protein [Nitrospiraceae bacterium]